MADVDPYGTRAELLPGVSYHRLGALAERGIGDVSRLPVTLKILLENSVRNAAAPSVRDGDVEAIASWDGTVTDADREPTTSLCRSSLCGHDPGSADRSTVRARPR